MSRRNRKPTGEAELRRAIRRECHRQLDAFFRLAVEAEDGDTVTMLDVLVAHAALGYGINVGVQVRHPEEEGRVVEDPSVAGEDAEPKRVIEVARG